MDKVIILADHVIGYRITEYLLKVQSAEAHKSFEIVHLFSNPPGETSWWLLVKDLALRYNLAYLDYSAALLDKILAEQECTHMLLLSWKHILPADIISKVKGSVVNLHYSLLPKHRGVYPVNQAIQSGDDETGITFHFVNASIDAGEIIAQKKIEINTWDDAKSLLIRLDDLAYNTFIIIWDDRSDWRKKSFVQSGDSNYTSMQKFEMSNEINLAENVNCMNFIRFLRAKTFGDKSSAFFIDQVSGKK